MIFEMLIRKEKMKSLKECSLLELDKRIIIDRIIFVDGVTEKAFYLDSSSSDFGDELEEEIVNRIFKNKDRWYNYSPIDEV